MSTIVEQNLSSHQTLSIPEVAKLLKVSEPTVRRRISDGSIPSIKVGTRRVVPMKHLQRWIDSQVENSDDHR